MNSSLFIVCVLEEYDENSYAISFKSNTLGILLPGNFLKYLLNLSLLNVIVNKYAGVTGFWVKSFMLVSSSVNISSIICVDLTSLINSTAPPLKDIYINIYIY